MKKVLLFILILFMPFFIKAEEINFNWFNNFGGTGDDILVDFIEVDGGFIALFYYNWDPSMMTNQDFWLIRYDVNGKELWSKKIGGNDWDGMGYLMLTSDNNLVVSYSTWSTDIEGLTYKGELDFVVLKLDFDGNIIWQNNFGGNGTDWISDFIQTNDGGFVAYGNTRSSDLELHPYNGGLADFYIFKISRNGELLWFDTFGGEGNEQFLDIVELNDNSLIVTGKFDSVNISGIENNGKTDTLLVRYDKNGNKKWLKTWGSNGHDQGSKLLVYENRDIFLVGTTSSDVNGVVSNDFNILKYDIDGNMLTQKSIESDFHQHFTNSFLTKNGNLVIIGFYYNFNKNGQYNYNDEGSFIGYLDNDGNLLWKKIFDGNANDYISRGFETENENLIFYGYLSSTNIEGIENKGGNDAYVAKYDKQGNLLWQHSYGSEKSDNFLNLINVEGENFLIAGNNSLFKYDKNGNVIWHKNFENVNASSIDFTNHLILSNGDLLLGGISVFTDLYNISSNGGIDAVFTKYSFKYNIESLPTKNGKFEVSHDGNKGLIKTVSNTGYEVDKIIIKDVLGDSVAATKLEDGNYTFDLYNDVNVEVLFKEELINPKTGDNILLSFITLFISICGFVVFFVFTKRRKVEL